MNLPSQIGTTGGWMTCELLIEGDYIDTAIGTATVHFDWLKPSLQPDLTRIEVTVFGHAPVVVDIDAMPHAWRQKIEADLALLEYPREKSGLEFLLRRSIQIAQEKRR